MPDDVVDDPRAELALVEQELADMAKEVEELREELGSRSDGPGDPVDNTTLIEQLNVDESLLSDLRRRRDDLRIRIGMPPGDKGGTATGE